MNVRNWFILGLALVLAFILTVSFPGGAQAQQKDPAATYGPPAQDYAGGYYGYDDSGYSYCPMGSGYGYSTPANRDYRNNGPRTWNNRGYQASWCSWNSGYAPGNRGGWGCW